MIGTTSTVTSSKPSRFAKLDAWLERNQAVQLWSAKVPNVGRMDAYQVNGRVVMVQRLKDGWDLFVPASAALSVNETLDAAAKVLECEGSDGL